MEEKKDEWAQVRRGAIERERARVGAAWGAEGEGGWKGHLQKGCGESQRISFENHLT